MAIYVNKKTAEDGSIKFYCPVKSEHFLFILKFKMKICESRPLPSSSFPTAIANRVASALDTSMSNQTHPNSSNIIPAIRSSMEIEGKLSYPDSHPPIEFPNSNSSPNFFVSNPLQDQNSSNDTKRRKRGEFQLSQEHDYKKSKLNSSRYEDEETSVNIMLDRKSIPEFGSRSNSISNGYSEIQMTKETPNVMKTIKQEHREQPQRSYEEYEYRKRTEQRPYEYDSRSNGKMIPENGRTSLPKSEIRNTAVNSVVEHKRVLFDMGPRTGGFLGKDAGNLFIKLVKTNFSSKKNGKGDYKSNTST